MSDPIKQLFTAEGTAHTPPSHRPLPWHDADCIWFVDEGQLDVFVVPVADDAVTGARQHLFRASAGQGVLAVCPKANAPLKFVAVPGPATRLLRIPLQRFEENNFALTSEIAELLDRGILAWHASLSPGWSPKKFAPLRPGQELEIAAACAVLPSSGIVWVQHRAGSSLASMLPDYRITPEDPAIPISSYAWLQTDVGTTLVGQATEDFLRTRQTQAALRQFGVLAVTWLAHNMSLHTQADVERLNARAGAQRRMVDNALTDLVEILGPPSSESKSGILLVDELLAACRLIGGELELEFKAAPPAPEHQELRDPLMRIADVSRVRFRRVVLSAGWWRQDGVPLLGYREESQRPVALLPGRGGYNIVDPANGSRTRVTDDTARTLRPFAFTFYRSFPQRALKLIDVAKFGFRGAKRDLLMLLGMGFLGGILGLLIPVTTGMLFDYVIPGAERFQLLQLTLGLLMVAFGVVTFQITRNVALLRLETRSDAAIQAAVWDRLLTLPVPFFRDYTSGDLAMRAGGINAIRQILSGAAVSALLAGVFSIFDFGLLFYYSLPMALLATVLVSVSVLATLGTTLLTLRFQRPVYELQGKISGLVLELITGISKLRVAGAEQQAYSVWARAFARQKKLDLKVGLLGTGLHVFNSAYPILTTMCLFAGLAFWTGDHMSTGAFLAFNVAFGGFLGAMLSMSSAFVSILDAIPLYERAKSILQTLPEVDEAKADPGELSGHIEVSHVFFRYTEGGPTILHDIAFEVQQGEFVAIVGSSGSGKSTLFRLLLGFDGPVSGAIYYDGHDLSTLDVHAVRRQFGVVLQNGKILPGSIFENIIGNTLLTHDDAWEAARKAGLAEDIERMPMQMHTVLGEGSGTLSGGQRQRLIIARAIVSRPRIVLLDEATSALDNRTQAIVSESLDHLQATRIVIAHRLSTIVHADRILVMRAGHLVQSGTYEQLLGQPGPFAELAKRQLA